MKSFIKIALLVFYVFFNAGLSYSMHYCGDDFQRINVFSEYKTCCESNTPMQGCCDDISNLELPNTDQQISDVLNLQHQTFEYSSPVLQFESPFYTFDIDEKTAFADSSPPLFHDTAIYIFCQVFLI
ncbi:MAG: hypothetical protein EA341_10920 [Mongoliibacter sp.]|uniref:HYC_CC_PP family protein n=1 Tax=Mongoliibacter sp. TaxID=2022438 RepID=UPI0012F15FC3|nr:hypothetical protein [Mongoliibacter sp.]TVP48392.1 MAG: hypothetical protein EA341_10920 [Mongoliibacter sp.]